MPQNNQEKGRLNGPVAMLLLVLGVVAVLATAQSWVKSLKMPFLIPVEERNANLNLNADIFTNSDLAKTLTLQGQDTDADGLSDYDELYVYQTSPYLEDSDSDGYKDLQEIQSNNDPNCPKGVVCSSSAANVNVNGALTDSLENLSNLSPEQLRTLLIQQGLKPEDVAKLDDATLKQTFQETLKNSQTGNDFSYLLSNTEINLTPAQIKEMLVAQGMKEEEVNKFSDAELLNIWQQALNQAKQQSSQTGQ